MYYAVAVSETGSSTSVMLSICAYIFVSVIVTMADLLWFKSYRPTKTGENILVGVGGAYE